MVQAKKRKSRASSSPTGLQLRFDESNKGEEEGEGSGTALAQHESNVADAAQACQDCKSEWDVAVDLGGIPQPLQASMLAVAPLLAGREAEYEDGFFSMKVGLCDKGPMVDEVGKIYLHILEGEIKKIWKLGSQTNRFEIQNCTSKEQARLFSKHFFQVYGNPPDNAYFSMRFLKASTATFVHGLEVNWVAEAQKHRSKRIETPLKNPYKLGPVALRSQVEGLVRIIKDLANGSPPLQMPCGLPPSVITAQQAVFDAAAAENSAMEVLQAAQKEKDDAEALLAKYPPEEVSKIEEETDAALMEQKRLIRMGAVAEYRAQVKVVSTISEKLANMHEELMVARSTIQRLDGETGPLSMAIVDFNNTKARRAEAEAALKIAKQENMILRPRAVFSYVDRQSVPVINGRCLNEWCPMCSKGFVSRAAILGSCGCLFHHVCVAEMLESNHYNCPFCNIKLDAEWVAQWGGKVTSEEDREIELTAKMLRSV